MRSRLVLLSVAVTSMVVVAFSLPLGLLVRDLAEDRAVRNAEREANALARTLAVLGEVSDETLVALIEGAGENVTLSVILPDDQVVGSAEGISDAVDDSLDGRSLLVEEAGGIAAYVPVAGLDRPVSVRSWVGSDTLHRNVSTTWLVLAVLGLLLIGMAAVLADRLGRSMVRPVVELAAATERLGAGDLETELLPSGPPELVAVGSAFNRLVGRMRGLLAAEREAVADVSHRLRTPLTALRLNAERSEGAEEILDDVDRLERAVDSVIADARRPVRVASEDVADLGSVVRARVRFWGPLAAEQGRQLEQKITPLPVEVLAISSDIAAVVDALLENVFAHTPEGTSLDVVVTDQATLVVCDRGPGFASVDLADRGVSGAGGTGLGLDIVRSTAEATGGSLTIESRPGGGSSIIVRFGVSEPGRVSETPDGAG